MLLHHLHFHFSQGSCDSGWEMNRQQTQVLAVRQVITTLTEREQLTVDESHPVPVENTRNFITHFTKIQASILKRYQTEETKT